MEPRAYYDITDNPVIMKSHSISLKVIAVKNDNGEYEMYYIAFDKYIYAGVLSKIKVGYKYINATEYLDSIKPNGLVSIENNKVKIKETL